MANGQQWAEGLHQNGKKNFFFRKMLNLSIPYACLFTKSLAIEYQKLDRHLQAGLPVSQYWVYVRLGTFQISIDVLMKVPECTMFKTVFGGKV